MLLGGNLERSITDRMRIIWETVLKQKGVPAGELPRGFVYRLRTHPIYQWILWATKRYILPTLFAALLLYLGLAVASRVLFAIGDSFGFVCRGTRSTPLTAKIVKSFNPSELCWASGAGLEAGRRYRITVTLDPTVPWRDGSIDTNLGGFGLDKMSGVMYLGLPLRRELTQPWFKPIARIGSTGGDEYPLTSVHRASGDDLKRELVTEFQARTRGELFLYVNDAVIGLPGIVDYFYVGKPGRNSGRADIRIESIE
jgi:hypothetical protein